MNKFLIALYKIFFVGLLVQFFAQTFVTFGLGIEIDYLWLWKEVVIGVIAILALVGVVWRGRRRQIIITPTIAWWTV